METIGLCAAQFGSSVSVEAAAGTSRQHLRGMAMYRVRYRNPASAVLAHGVIFDLAVGEGTLTGRDPPDKATAL